MDTDRYFARWPKRCTEEWPFWYVADRKKADLNVTDELIEKLHGKRAGVITPPLVSRDEAIALAEKANEAARAA